MTRRFVSQFILYNKERRGKGSEKIQTTANNDVGCIEKTSEKHNIINQIRKITFDQYEIVSISRYARVVAQVPCKLGTPFTLSCNRKPVFLCGCVYAPRERFAHDLSNFIRCSAPISFFFFF